MLSTSCSETASIADVAQAKVPIGTQAAPAAPDRLADLEKRVTRLEQGLDERAIEYNMVQSALMYMLVDTKLSSIPGNKSYTSDMRQFPSPATPLYGFDKNKDGKPDTNYFPFEKTKWSYKLDSNEFRALQFIDPKLVETWGRDIGRGRTESYETELHNIQTAVMAMLADSTSGNLTGGTGVPQTNMRNIASRGKSGTLYLSDYLTGLNSTSVPSGCTYSFTADGTVTQTTP